jgi:Resolvase, N terminal domain
VSGSKESRPALNRLMADELRRKWDVVAVWRLDRFRRTALPTPHPVFASPYWQNYCRGTKYQIQKREPLLSVLLSC